ncbi:MAG: nitroreductase family protein [bacterium]
MSGFGSLVTARFSCRSYRTDPVPRAAVEQILNAARLAPSACNQQPWRFAVATEAGLRAQLLSEGILPGLGMTWAANAPVILVLGMKKSLITHRVAPLLSKVEYPLLDLGIAGEHAILQATELGLGTCWIGWIRPKEVRRIVGWPSDILPQALITVGWPISRPQRPSPRLPLDEIVTWRE